jgi:hypothetical protein
MRILRIITFLAAAIFAAIGLFIQDAAAQGKVPAKTQAAAEYKRLLDLQAALKKIPMEKQNREPHKSFLKRNANKIVYSDPSADYYVRSELFWALSKKYKTLPIADDIAWTAAQNMLPGECEGFLTCYMYVLAETEVRYLKLFPNGKYSRRAVQSLIDNLTGTVEDLGKNAGHTGPEDAAEKAELAKQLRDMRFVLEKVSRPEKAKLLDQIKLIGDAYK